MLYKKLKAFTLIELLVVIAIIGILSTLVIISLGDSRASARDAKRLNDLKAMANALELYYADNNEYPSSLTPGETLEANDIVYISPVPSNPTPHTDGGCADSNYQYEVSQGGAFYSITTCIGSNSGSLFAGPIVATPNGVEGSLEARVYFDSMATALSPAQQERIKEFTSLLYSELGVNSLADVFDFLYLHANETEEAGLKNLVKREHDAVNVNTATFTQWEGFTGGTPSYLDTTYIASTQAESYTLNSASIGVYSRTNIDQSALMGVHSNTSRNLIRTRTGGSLSAFGLNTNSTPSLAVNGGMGFFIMNRIAADNFFVYKNGSLVSTLAGTSSQLPAIPYYLLAQNYLGDPTGYSAALQISVSFAGRGLSVEEVAKVTNAVEWYMDDLGKGVID